jgi:hypothetical protein
MDTISTDGSAWTGKHRQVIIDLIVGIDRSEWAVAWTAKKSNRSLDRKERTL